MQSLAYFEQHTEIRYVRRVSYIQPLSISLAVRGVRVATAPRVGIVADKVQPWPWKRGERPLALHGPPLAASWAASPRNLFRPARAHRDRGRLPCSSSCHFLVAAVRALDGFAGRSLALPDLSPLPCPVPRQIQRPQAQLPRREKGIQTPDGLDRGELSRLRAPIFFFRFPFPFCCCSTVLSLLLFPLRLCYLQPPPPCQN